MAVFKSTSTFACYRHAWPAVCRARSAPTPNRSGHSDSTDGYGHSGHDFRSSTSAAAPQNQAATLESQTIHPIQYVLGQTLRTGIDVGFHRFADMSEWAKAWRLLATCRRNRATACYAARGRAQPSATRVRVERSPTSRNLLFIRLATSGLRSCARSSDSDDTRLKIAGDDCFILRPFHVANFRFCIRVSKCSASSSDLINSKQPLVLLDKAAELVPVFVLHKFGEDGGITPVNASR
jgi:hypothetical protein